MKRLRERMLAVVLAATITFSSTGMEVFAAESDVPETEEAIVLEETVSTEETEASETEESAAEEETSSTEEAEETFPRETALSMKGRISESFSILRESGMAVIMQI